RAQDRRLPALQRLRPHGAALRARVQRQGPRRRGVPVDVPSALPRRRGVPRRAPRGVVLGLRALRRRRRAGGAERVRLLPRGAAMTRRFSALARASAALAAALVAALPACAAGRQLVADSADLTDYRAFRVAAFEGTRLARASAYLEAHPRGAWAEEV